MNLLLRSGLAISTRRVIYLVTTLGHGGTERNLVQFCKTVDPLKYEIEVWYLYETEKSYLSQLQELNIKLKHLNSPNGFRPGFLWSVARKLNKAQADLVHVFLPTVAYYAIASRVLFRSRKPMLFSSGGFGMYLPLQRQMMKYGIGRYCYPIICNSQAVVEFWRDELGVDSRRLRLISNGHEISRFQAEFDRSETRKNNDLDPDSLVVTTVGRMLDSKRHVDMIEAFSRVRKEYPNAVFQIIGDGDLAPYQQQVDELGITQSVRFLGHRNDVVELLRASDMFLFGTELEGLPNALIEAALSRLPIVSTNIGPVKAVVENEKSALLVDTRRPDLLAKSMLRLVREKDFARQLAAAAFEVAVQKFDIRNTVNELYVAYDDAMLGFRKATAIK